VRVTRWPPALRRRHPDPRAGLYRIDLDGDRKPEFIVQDPSAESGLRTCYLDSSLVQQRCDEGRPDGWVHYWFVELEKGAPLFLMVLFEDEDGHEFSLEKVDPRTWEREKILDFEAVAVSRTDRTCRWSQARPRLITGIPLERRAGHVLLRVSPRGAYDEGPDAPPDDRPVIVFSGSLPGEYESRPCRNRINGSRWMTLPELIELGRDPGSSAAPE
jgi:hypothetical protein